MRTPKFPKGFLWGASTAAHQVEGNNHNQWAEWEQVNAERLARTAKQRLSWLPSWESIKQDATSLENYVSGAAVGHYERYEDDFNTLAA